ncbi:gasdermin-C-like [Talpa occidentalis]|uniref:gasdermin-C-like n=1 Tax=Talpa occidentalis TaxID=50954 RepID=UPI00188F2744|nr:gasdermin-C-like [Talpa occidentalis]
MPSFQNFSKIMKKEIGDKEMKHVKYVDHASCVKLYSILVDDKRFSRFWKKDHRPLSFSLLDILEPSSSLPEADVNGPLDFKSTRLKGMEIVMTVDAVAEANVEVDSSHLQKSSLQYNFVEILEPKLEDLRKRKLLDPQPSYMNQYRRSGKNLYMVTKTVELFNSAVLRDISSRGVSGGVSFPWNFIKIKPDVKGQTVRKLVLSLQKGMVMAYKKKLLVFEDDGWDIVDDLDDKGQSFPEEAYHSCMPRKMEYDPTGPISPIGSVEEPFGKKMEYDPLGPISPVGSIEEPSGQESCSSESSEMWSPPISPIPPIGSIEQPFGQNFECMKEEISSRVEMVDLLSRNIQGVIFVNIQAMLGDRRALEALMDKLDQEKPVGHLNGPGGTILDELGRIPEDPHDDAVELILYLLEAIMVLSDTQHALLAQSMEKRILLHQRELVRSILEPNFKYPWWIPFTLDSQLLALLQDEGVAITYGLLQECGLRMELNNPRSTWDLEAKEPLSALYAALCLLQQLTKA